MVNFVTFLTTHQDLSFRSLNVIRSAAASVFNILHPDKKTIAKDPYIAQFFKTKRRNKGKIPTKTQEETWDANLIINYILSLGPTAQLNLELLQKKVIILLGVATMWRVRSDLGRLQANDIKFHFDDNGFTGMTLYSREPKEGQIKSSKLGVTTNSELCPVLSTQMFLERTENLRAGLPDDHTLFLANINNSEKVNSASPKTVANWVHQIMIAAKIDPQYKPHSLRAAASTKAIMKGISIPEVKTHANWSQESNTFEQIYNRRDP